MKPDFNFKTGAFRQPGIYLGACKARHFSHDLIYQDIDEKYDCDIGGDMLDVDLKYFDYVIATPPCNWWSKANPYYWHSVYSWKTLALLPLVLIKLHESGLPFICENVINRKRFTSMGIYKLCDKYGIKVVEVGRHTYFTNTDFDLSCEQQQDFVYGGKRINKDGYNQGGLNVWRVIEKWLVAVEGYLYAGH